MISNIPYLTIPNNPQPIEICELTEEKYLDLKRASENIHEFLYYKRRLLEIKLNKDDLISTLDYYREIYKKSIETPIGNDFKEEAYVNINRRVNNFIASFVSLTEHCEEKIKSVYGKESSQKIAFKKYESGLYDKFFSYRFLKLLRNYAIHANYPVEYVSFVCIYDDSCINNKRYDVETLCSRDKLLLNTKLKTKIGEDLEKLDKTFDIMKYVEEIEVLINSVLKEFIKIACREFIDSATKISMLSKHHEQLHLSLTRVDLSIGKTEYNSIILPIEMAEELLNLID